MNEDTYPAMQEYILKNYEYLFLEQVMRAKWQLLDNYQKGEESRF